MLRWLPLVLAAAGGAAARSIPPDFGPYIRYTDRVGSCDERNEQQGKLLLRCSHYNPHKPFEPQHCRGNVTIVEDIDETYWFSGVMDRRSNNQWKKNFLVRNVSDDPAVRAYMHTGDACEKFKDMFLATPSRFGDNGPCIVRKGTHRIDAVSNPKPRHGDVSTFSYGFYRERYMFGKGTRILLCYWAEVHFVQRPGLR